MLSRRIADRDADLLTHHDNLSLRRRQHVVLRVQHHHAIATYRGCCCEWTDHAENRKQSGYSSNDYKPSTHGIKSRYDDSHRYATLSSPSNHSIRPTSPSS